MGVPQPQQGDSKHATDGRNRALTDRRRMTRPNMHRLDKPSRRGAATATLALALLSLSPVTAASAADACPNADARKGAAAHLPECRAYEQVSPVDKNGGSILWNAGGAGAFDGATGGRSVADDGETALMASFGEFADMASGGGLTHNEYLSRRTSTGWETVAMTPRPRGIGGGSLRSRAMLSGIDLARSLIGSDGVLTDDMHAVSSSSTQVYERDNVFDRLWPLFSVANFEGFEARTGTPDLTRIAFASQADLLPGQPDTSAYKVYEVVDRQLRLVSIKPDGTPFETDAVPGMSKFETNDPSSLAGAVSSGGAHVFFTTPISFDQEVYRRSHGTTTVHASPSKLAVADPLGRQGKLFRAATPDGGRVLFTSAERLTLDANTGSGATGSDLYRYDIDEDELVDISSTPVDGDDGARVQGVVGLDTRAERVYYVGLGAVGSSPGPSEDQPNLYLYEDGQSRFIATLAVGDEAAWRRWDGRKTARVTADGRFLLFQSAAAIPGHQGGGVSQLYRFDAEADPQDALECVSCNPTGSAPAGASFVSPHAEVMAGWWELPRALSGDGRRVFFSSGDALVGRDSNGKVDAYMWRDGVVSLLSSGTSPVDSFFYNASVDGDDAFFLTRDALVAQDGDNLSDLYDARVNGGFAPAVDSDCLGEACQGSASGAPSASDPASEGFRGRGSGGSLRVAGLRVSRLSRAQLTRLVRGRAVGLRVRVGAPGVVRAVALRGRARWWCGCV
jgi:hypothetical protein